jgi:hypothetical protein
VATAHASSDSSTMASGSSQATLGASSKLEKRQVGGGPFTREKEEAAHARRTACSGGDFSGDELASEDRWVCCSAAPCSGSASQGKQRWAGMRGRSRGRNEEREGEVRREEDGPRGSEAGEGGHGMGGHRRVGQGEESGGGVVGGRRERRQQGEQVEEEGRNGGVRGGGGGSACGIGGGHDGVR